MGAETTGATQGKELGAEGKNPEFMMRVGKRGGRTLSVSRKTEPMDRAHSESGVVSMEAPDGRVIGVEWTLFPCPSSHPNCSFHNEGKGGPQIRARKE